MLINADAKALEWLAATYLSKDKTAYGEIIAGTDQHSDNQQRLKLPTRLIAKTFLFRLIYGGSAYAYANDPEFTAVSSSDKFWQKLIEEFYSKYSGLYQWHGNLMREVVRTGKIVMPTGREYAYQKHRGEWPRTTILNYPVQGFGADLMAIARVSLYRRLRASSLTCKLICTVHDSIVLDAHDSEVDNVVQMIYDVWKDIPVNYQRLFGSKFDLPCKVEISVGPDWHNLVEIK